jgi:moderate conductance mechanosensitive channel
MQYILPVGIAIIIFAIAFFLRRIAYKRFRIWAARTKSKWDDIMVHSTSLASFLWCLWLGIYSGLVSSQLVTQIPQNWQEILNRIIPGLFIALGIYSVIMIIMGTLKWYKIEVCSRTKSSLDDVIMSVLIIGTPVVSGILGIILILKMQGIESETINNWIAAHGAKLAFIIIFAVCLLLLTVQVIPKLVHSAVRNSKAEQTEEELAKRSDTLISVIVTTLQIAIIFILFLMILSELGTNITAILTGAGVLGIAIGFGAQSLVKDVIAGLFIIMENQYRKGDVVKIADTSGVVEDINLRRTILRDLDGITHVIPNGETRITSNFTKLWSRVNLNISVSYGTDLDKAIDVINKVGKELAEDPKWAPDILTPPKALRVDNLGSSGIDIKILGETKPIRQWDVMGELRLRLKRAFDKEGLEIPWPHTKVYFGNLPEIIVSNKKVVQDKNKSTKNDELKESFNN